MNKTLSYHAITTASPYLSYYYVVYGVKHGLSNTPHTWVRLCVLEEWRTRETKFGIIMQSNNRVDGKGKGSASPMSITQAFELKTGMASCDSR